MNNMSVDRKKYAVVEFYDGLQVIPSCWIQKDNVNCFWPTHLTSKSSIDRAVIRQYMPQEGKEWPTLQIIKIFGQSDDYIKALDMLVTAEDTSTLQDSNIILNSTSAMIAARKSRLRRHRKKFSDESTDMDNDEDEEEKLQNACKISESAIKKKLSIEAMMGKPPYVAALSSANEILVSSTPPQHSSTPSSNTMRDRDQSRRPASPQKEVVVSNGFQELMLRKMNSIISKLTNIDNRINQLESQSRARTMSEDTHDDDEEIVLPIKTMHELEEFEDRLKNNTFLAKMHADTVGKTAKANNDISWDTIVINTRVPIQIVSAKKTGGNTVNTASAAILKKLLDDSVAEQFSWDGKKQKKEFKTLLTAKLLRKAVHSMCQPACTDLQIKSVASQWLAQAKTRRKRREKRFNERMNQAARDSNSSN